MSSGQSFMDAQKNCITKRGNLVSLNDQNEMDFILNFRSYSTLWVELN
jgi:hypothetical protein